jgi:hypothetical protein
MEQAPRRPWFILLVTLGGVAVCAIPFVGALVGIIAGLTMLAGNRREVGWARLHAGAVVHGRVVSPAAVTAPVSGLPAAFAAVTGVMSASIEKGVNERRLEQRSFGEALAVEDGAGRVEVELERAHLLSRHVHRHDEHNAGPLPALRERCWEVPDGAFLEVEELRLEPGDEVWVAGRVAAAGPGGVRRVTEARVTNLSPTELQRVSAMAPGFTVMAVVWLVAAVASLAYWGWRCFA